MYGECLDAVNGHSMMSWYGMGFGGIGMITGFLVLVGTMIFISWVIISQNKKGGN